MTNIKKRIYSEAGIGLMAFILPVLIYGVIFAYRRIWPFGDTTLMTGDMEYQFTDYLAYLKTIVFGNNDFFYSFSKNLGGSMAGFSAYYYFCPLNWITLLFDNKMLPASQSLIVAMNGALCSLSFSQFLIQNSRIHKERREIDAVFALKVLIFSLSYAMSGFITVYFQLTIYFGNLILFPLIMLGIIKLVENPEKRIFYIITLGLSIIFNYYSGYMICIFSLVFFLYQVAMRKVAAKEALKIGVVFAYSSIIAVMLSCVVLIPAVLSLSGEKDVFSLGFYRTFSLMRLPLKLLCASFDGNISMGLPNIYCGMFTVLMAFAFFVNKEIGRREKAINLIVLVFLVINMNINTLNVIWHGMNQPIGFPYRYSYMLSFMIIYIAFNYTEMSDSDCKVLGNNRHLIWGIAAIFTIVDIAYNASDVFGKFELASLSKYQQYLADVGGLIEETDRLDDNPNLYRLEKYFRRTHNDAMQFNYMGLSHFSSSEKKEKINFLGKLGFRNNGNWSFYDEGTTMFLDSFLGVKYILSLHHRVANHYKRVIYGEEYTAFQNEEALPLLFSSDKGIREIDFHRYENPFALLEAIADSMNSKKNHIFRAAQVIGERYVNLEMSDLGGCRHFVKKKKEEKAFVEYDLKVEDESNLFLYLDAPDKQKASISMIFDKKHEKGYEEDMGEYFTVYRWNIVNMQDHEPGKPFRIRINALSDTLDLTASYMYFEDRDRCRRLMNEIKMDRSSLKRITSSKLEGEMVVKDNNKCAVMSIPYDEAWKVYVDGNRVLVKQALGMLLSFDLEAGHHKIRLEYSPRGYKAGVFVSFVGVIVLICMIYCKKFSEKKC